MQLYCNDTEADQACVKFMTVRVYQASSAGEWYTSATCSYIKHTDGGTLLVVVKGNLSLIFLSLVGHCQFSPLSQSHDKTRIFEA